MNSKLSQDANTLYCLLESLTEETRDQYSHAWSPKKLKQLREIMRHPRFSEMLEAVEQKERFLINKELIPELKDTLALFFKTFPKVTKFVIKGYTPDFNDGDKCEHSTDVEIGGIISPCKDYYGNNPNKDAEHWLFNNMEILLSIYGTDWEFTAINQNGNISFHKEDYDCGY